MGFDGIDDIDWARIEQIFFRKRRAWLYWEKIQNLRVRVDTGPTGTASARQLMLKKFAICTLGLATGIGVAATTQPYVSEILGYKTDDDAAVVEVAKAVEGADDSAVQAVAERDKLASEGGSTVGLSGRENETAKADSKVAMKSTVSADAGEKNTSSEKVNSGSKPNVENIAASQKRVDSEKIKSVKIDSLIDPELRADPRTKIAKKLADKEMVTKSISAPSASVAKSNLSAKADAPDKDDMSPNAAKQKKTAALPLTIGGYEAKVHESNGFKLPYRILGPKKLDSDKSYPLVIFLHGAGERGDDNEAQLKHASQQFASYLAKENEEAFIVFPQCPVEQQWSDLKWSDTDHKMNDEPSLPMKGVMSLMDQILIESPIDEDRIYAVGLSMGGYGALDLVARRPKMFAAVASCCGGADCSEPVMQRLTGLPLYIVHGDADGVVDVQNARNIVEQVEKSEGDVVYKELAGVGHDCWTPTFNDAEFFEWLFSQSQNKESQNKNLQNKKSPKDTNNLASNSLAASAKKEMVVARKPMMPKAGSKAATNNSPEPVATKDAEVATAETSAKKPSGTAKPAKNRFAKKDVSPPRKESGKNVDATAVPAIARPRATNKVATKAPAKDQASVESTKEVSAKAAEKISLDGEWKVAKGIYNGKPIPAKVLKKMKLAFEDQLMTLSQGRKVETGKVFIGETAILDGKQVQALTVVSPQAGMPDIDAVFFAEGKGIVMIWNGPGQPRPTTIKPESLPKSRIMWLQR